MSKLREYRESKGLSQEALAKSVGVRKAAISRIELGRRTPSMGLVARLVAVSDGDLSADDFLPSEAEPAV